MARGPNPYAQEPNLRPSEPNLTPSELALANALELAIDAWLHTQKLQKNTYYVYVWEFKESKKIIDALVARYGSAGWGMSKGVVAEIGGMQFGEFTLLKANLWGAIKAVWGGNFEVRRNRNDIVVSDEYAP